MSRSIRLLLLAASAPLALQANAAEAPKLKFCPGFTIVTAVSGSHSDYESIKTIDAVDDKTVHLRYSSESYEVDMFAYGPGELKKTLTKRTMRVADLKESNLYLQHFGEQLPELVPETTAISISAQTFHELKTAGKAQFGVFVPFNVDKPGIDREQHPNVYDSQMVTEVTRTPNPPPMKVTLNNKLVEIPVMRFEGDFYGDRSEFFVIDDPALPLMLKFRIGIDANAPLTDDEKQMLISQGRPPFRSRDREVLQVVKIIAPCAPVAPPEVKPAPVEVKAGPPPVPKGEPIEVKDVPPPAPSPLPEVAAAPPPPPTPTPPVPPPASPAPTPPPPPVPPAVVVPKTPVEVTSAAIEKTVEAEGRVNIDAIFFTVDSANLRAESDVALNAIADMMKRNPTWKFTVEGHTDSQGGAPYNLDLSNRRAAAVKTALATRFGIAADRLASKGFGLTKPVADNASLEGRARNRRVELVRLP